MKFFQNKLLKGIMLISICFGTIFCLNHVDASITKNLPKSIISDVFPQTYNSYIEKLKKIYPNAIFKAVYTGLDFNTVVTHECYETKAGISLVPSSYTSVWKKDGKNIYKDGNWVVASKSAVAYVIDPRNMLYERYIFQFEGLTYNNYIDSSVVEKVIASSPLVGTYEKKYKNAGKWVEMDNTYAEIIDMVGKDQNVSSVYIASLLIQETSGDIVNNGSINGSNETYPGVYNFFNIGATPNADGTGSVTNGLKYAKSQGWTTPYLSINGGVKNIKKSYIQYGQDTIYFQKFDVNNPYGNAAALMAYQYQTNILAPRSESIISYNAYKKLNMLDTAFTFYIPVYNNMPEDPTPYPAGDKATFDSDNTKVYLDDLVKNGTDAFYIRSSANSELDNVIYTMTETKEGADNRTILTRTKKGNGYSWDYVEFEVGGKVIKGYVWSDYVQEYNYTKVESVELDKSELTLELDEEYTLTAIINPTDAKYKDVEWKVTDDNIVSINNGKVIAKGVGETTVTVRTVDNGKEAICKVIVTPKIKSISLDKEEYIMYVDGEIKPVITTKNIDEDAIIIIEDENIAEFVEGKIIAKTIGETKIIASAHDNVTEAVIKVIERPEENITLDDSLNLNENILTGILPNTKVKDVLEKISLTNLNVLFKNSKDKELTIEDIVTTDTKVIMTKQDSSEYVSYTISIRGDANGDGIINSGDLLRLVKYLKGTAEANIVAADANKDGVINSGDLLRLVKYLKGTSTIDFK